MLALPIVDVALGLVFVFLLLSLVVTAANELLSSWLKRRSTTLWRGMVRLLTDSTMADQLYKHPLITGLNETPWFERYRDRLPFKKRPSYIPSRTFALALLDTLAPASAGVTTDANRVEAIRAALEKRPQDGGLPPALAKSLIVLLEDAGGNLEDFKASIEIWFNSAMDRVSGWYKRRTQWILMLLAIIVTIAMNADTIVITQTLWRDPAVRASLVNQAQQYAEQNRREEAAAVASEVQTGPSSPPDVLPYETAEQQYEAASERFSESVTAVQNLAVPIGWADSTQPGDKREKLPDTPEAWWNAICTHGWGWLLTTLAISLGAPFWFDILNKVIGIRAAGKAPEEKPKAPKKVPIPREPGGLPVT